MLDHVVLGTVVKVDPFAGLYSDQGLPSGASCRDCDDTYPLVGFYLPMFPFFILGREINWML
ncbi:hypothetical protein NQ317_011145 [Molorchus minor]|uniref:Uncharacterized protein n=1 Tax=Molorchus minor TaxID=1323400 RepID=A0ABQ9JG16_9CUCU|nr:hypothetical protein NQ317_011145 [Molorchus minor]